MCVCVCEILCLSGLKTTGKDLVGASLEAASQAKGESHDTALQVAGASLEAASQARGESHDKALQVVGASHEAVSQNLLIS